MIPLVVLVILHAPNGHEILLNPRAVTSMHAAVPGKTNELIVDDVRCVINTYDGKFVSVIEPCDTVRQLLRQPERAKK